MISNHAPELIPTKYDYQEVPDLSVQLKVVEFAVILLSKKISRKQITRFNQFGVRSYSVS